MATFYDLPCPCAFCPFRPRCRQVAQHQILTWTSRCPILKKSVDNLLEKHQSHQPRPVAFLRLFEERILGLDPANLN